MKGVEFMYKIIPIRDLKNTSAISQMCHESEEPVFITKNGYGDMVIMSLEMYERKMFMNDVYTKLVEADEQVKEGKMLEADVSLKSIRKKYNV
jgi:PHD/YefM family antitoxin component YafN of YafNO toxin-antitoxin module